VQLAAADASFAKGNIYGSGASDNLDQIADRRKPEFGRLLPAPFRPETPRRGVLNSVDQIESKGNGS
jgi:hypothetical protein